MTANSTGRCWKLEDDVSSDALIAANHVFEYDPRILRRHLLEETRPELAAQAQAGDFLLAGRRFAHGSQHSHPFLAMKEMGLGLLAVGLTRAPFRLAVYMGVPLLEIDPITYHAIHDGDAVEADFARGRVTHLRTGQVHQSAPLPGFLLEIVQAGGGLAYLRRNAAKAA